MVILKTIKQLDETWSQAALWQQFSLLVNGVCVSNWEMSIRTPLSCVWT